MASVNVVVFVVDDVHEVIVVILVVVVVALVVVAVVVVTSVSSSSPSQLRDLGLAVAITTFAWPPWPRHRRNLAVVVVVAVVVIVTMASSLSSSSPGSHRRRRRHHGRIGSSKCFSCPAPRACMRAGPLSLHMTHTSHADFSTREFRDCFDVLAPADRHVELGLVAGCVYFFWADLPLLSFGCHDVPNMS
jgi:hypothetical protein